jgi:hypothetical protein
MSLRAPLIATALCLAVLPLAAQTVEGSINGTVADQTGSVIVDASVEIVNQVTGQNRTATTSANGTFTVPSLSPGFYTVSVSKTGFARQAKKGVEVLVAEGLTLDFSLSPGTMQQTIEVIAAPPALETTSGTLGTVIERQEIVDMPLNGGNFTQLMLLTPGTAPVEGTQQTTRIVQEGAGAISPSVAGQRGQQNNYTLDGALNNSVYTNTWAISPPPAAIEEFNVRSHVNDALATVSSGANVNVMTRSGTNSLHGALREFLANDKLNARNFFATSNLPYKQNQYGVTIGGPVRLPHYDGRKRNTWFFGYWEGFRSRQTNSYFASVPTVAERAGDFSAFLGKQEGTDSLNRPVMTGAIYDLATAIPNPSKAGSVLKDPFPGNAIPVSRFSAAAVAILQKYYPLPNLAVAPTVFPNLQFTNPVQVNDDKVGIKIDHRFGNNDTLFGRFNWADPDQLTPASLPAYNRSITNDMRSVALGYIHLLGPATVLSIHYSYLYTRVLDLYDPAGDSFINSTHLANLLPPHDGFALMPTLSVSQSFTGITQTAVPLGPDRNHAANADLTAVRGAHSLSAGFMYYHIHHFDDNTNAALAFARNATSLDGYTTTTGLGAASLLLGAPDTLSGWLGNTSADFNVNWIGGYLEDKWQITGRLTLSLGLRYDFVPPAVWANDKLSAVDVNSGALLIPVAFPPLVPHPTTRPTLFDPDYNGWQPRFGLAYRLAEKTVIRTGFALFQDHNNPMIQETQAIRIAWPWGYYANMVGLNEELPSGFTLDNLPAQASFYNPIQPAPSYAADPREKTPYSMEYNFGFQQQITSSLSAEMNYVGSLSRHQELPLSWNTAVYPAQGAVGPRTPFPQYPTNMQVVVNSGNASYNGLLAKLQKRMSNGLYFLASYTLSKSLDVDSEGGANNQVENEYDLRSSYGPSNFDIRQMFVLSGSYQVPVGKGKQFLASAGKLTNALVGGWVVSGIQSVTTGLPFSISAGADVANIGVSTGQRAQLVGDPFTGFTQSRLEWFNKTAFKTPTSYTYGNSGKDIMRGPRQTNLDFGAHKEFTFTESMKLQFRAEFFNALNHTRFGLPGANVQGPSTLGVITTAGSPRVVQIALKLSY